MLAPYDVPRLSFNMDHDMRWNRPGLLIFRVEILAMSLSLCSTR